MEPKKKSNFKKKSSYVKGLITRANKKIAQLREAGVLDQSFAYSEAVRTMYKSSQNAVYQDSPFSIEGLTTVSQLDKEKGRLLAFLGSEFSNPENVKYDAKIRQDIEDLGGKKEIEKDIKQAKKKYGGEVFGRYADMELDDVRKSVAAEVYRNLEESYKNIIGKAAFDSDTLISILYDQTVEAMEGWDVKSTVFEGRKDVVGAVLAYGQTILEGYKTGHLDKRYASKNFNYGRLRRRKMRGRK